MIDDGKNVPGKVKVSKQDQDQINNKSCGKKLSDKIRTKLMADINKMIEEV